MSIIQGTDRSENIYGSDFNDIIFGNGGNDAIWGYFGNDEIHGGTGSDVIRAGAGNDDLWGDAGINDLFGGSGADVFHVSSRGNSFSDDWIGDFQFDIDQIDVRRWGITDFSQIKALLRTDFTGSAWFNAYYNGKDHFLTIDGVAPGDLIASDFIYANTAAQNVTGTDRNDTLFGSRFDDVLNGGGEGDVLLGGVGHDQLSGGDGFDRLIGGTGADRLTGNSGRDVLTGDGGNDIFDFNKLADSLSGQFQDSITDFDRSDDIIDLAGVDANSVVGGNQAFNWIGGAEFSVAGQLRYYFSDGMTIVSGNVDNDLLPEFQFDIDGQLNLSDIDFIL